MTPAQKEELERMTPGEIARKYTKRLLNKEISQVQFDYLVGLSKCVAKPEEWNQSLDVISQFTDEDQMTGKSQKDRLHGLLKDGVWHDTVEILGKVYGGDHLGLARIGARVWEIKAEGHKIECRKKMGSVWEYRLTV